MRKRYDILKPATKRTRRPGRPVPGSRAAALLRRLLAKYRLRSRADGFDLLYRLESGSRAPAPGGVPRQQGSVRPHPQAGPVRIHLAFSTQVFQRSQTIQNGPAFHYTLAGNSPDATPATTAIANSNEPRVRDLLRTPPEEKTPDAHAAAPLSFSVRLTHFSSIRSTEHYSRIMAGNAREVTASTRLQPVTLLHNSTHRPATDRPGATHNEILAFEPLENRQRERAGLERQDLREPLELVTRRVPAGGARTQNETGGASGEFAGNRNGSSVRTAQIVQGPGVPEKPKAADVADAVRDAVRDLSQYEIGSLTEKVVRQMERQIQRDMDRRGLK